jgi:hypothetical protein
VRVKTAARIKTATRGEIESLTEETERAEQADRAHKIRVDAEKIQYYKEKRIRAGEIVTPGGLYCLCGRLLIGKRIEKRMCFRCEQKILAGDRARQSEVRQECFNKQDLYSRGWKRSLMQHLGSPDHVVTKPGFSCREHLYERTRVLKAERSLQINAKYLPGKMRLGRWLTRIADELIGPLPKGDLGVLRMVLNGSAERTVAAKCKVSRQSVSRMKLTAVRALERAGVELPGKLMRWRRSIKTTNTLTESNNRNL